VATPAVKTNPLTFIHPSIHPAISSQLRGGEGLSLLPQCATVGAATANGGEPLNKSDACRTQPQKKLHNNCIYLSSSTDFFAPWWYEQSRYHHQSTFVDNMLTSSSSSKTGKTPKARPVDKNVAAGPAMTKAKEATPSPA